MDSKRIKTSDETRHSAADLGVHALFDIIREPVIVAERNTCRIALWNEAAIRSLGYSREEAIGRAVDDFLRLDKGKLRAALEQPHGPWGEGLEWSFKTKDHGEVRFEISVAHLPADESKGEFVAIILRDMSHQVNKRRVEEMEKANQALKDFMSVASHDLRSPLTSILGFSSTILKSWDALDDDKKKSYLEIIERQARQINRLVNDLLTISRIEAGAIESFPEKMNVKKMIEDSIVFYQSHSDISVSCPSDLEMVGDTDHIHRILANYMGNAVKYGEPPFRVEAEKKGQLVEISVIDHGEGVPPEFEEQLFTKFARAKPQAKKEKGTGLGLSIVRGLALANGGDAWHERNEPRGSRFVLKLPSA